MASQAGRSPIITAPPRVVTEPDRQWADNLVRWLERFVVEQRGAGALRGGTLYLSNLPSNGFCLKAGEVFENNGILTIVRENDIWTGPLSTTVTAGAVTVTIT